jgi:heterodisulfide reductase subunit A-like polyferredoxin
MAEMGVANAIAKSSFVNHVDEELCTACGLCVEQCQFDALELEEVVRVIEMRCVGCGVCVIACPEGALSMIRRPEDQISPLPVSEHDWMEQRAASRGIDLNVVR